jgi:histidinol-phosphate phosphatase family protein
VVVFPPEIRALPDARTAPGPRRPAVFFDRDDTLIANATLPAEAFAGTPGDLADPAWIRPLPDAIDACARAVSLGYAVVLVTNQGVVARGGATLDEVEAACVRTIEVLGPGIEACFACPFHPNGAGPAELCREHPWRKPQPGMLLAASELLGLDLAGSWMVGDAVRDVEAGEAAGLLPSRCLLLSGEMTLAAALDRVARHPVGAHG